MKQTIEEYGTRAWYDPTNHHVSTEMTERERALERSRRYQARMQKYRTTCPTCGSTKKQKECKKCIV